MGSRCAYRRHPKVCVIRQEQSAMMLSSSSTFLMAIKPLAHKYFSTIDVSCHGKVTRWDAAMLTKAFPYEVGLANAFLH